MRGRRRKSHTEEDILITPCDPNSKQLAGVRDPEKRDERGEDGVTKRNEAFQRHCDPL